MDNIYILETPEFCFRMNIKLKVASSSKIVDEEPSPSERIERKKERTES